MEALYINVTKNDLQYDYGILSEREYKKGCSGHFLTRNDAVPCSLF